MDEEKKWLIMVGFNHLCWALQTEFDLQSNNLCRSLRPTPINDRTRTAFIILFIRLHAVHESHQLNNLWVWQ